MASLTRPVANRAVHLRIHPRPSSLGENREVLRLLSGFGEIEYFKSLKYERLSSPATALVIYRDGEAAKECLMRSPIRFRMGRRTMTDERLRQAQGQNQDMGESDDFEKYPRGPVGAPFGLSGFGQTRSISTRTAARREFQPFLGDWDHNDLSSPASPESTSGRLNPSSISLSTAQSASTTNDEPRIFQIIANRCTRHFRDFINIGHYHGTFAIDSKMFGQADMAKRVPLPGLSLLHWKAEKVPWHVSRRERMWEHSGPTRRRPLGEISREAHHANEIEADVEDRHSATAFPQFPRSEP